MVNIYFTDTVELRRYTFDEFDNKIEVETARRTLDCRVDPLEHSQIGPKGNELVISNKLVCDKDEDVQVKDEIFYLGKEWVIKQVKHGLGLSGDEYKEVIIGRIIFDYYA